MPLVYTSEKVVFFLLQIVLFFIFFGGVDLYGIRLTSNYIVMTVGLFVLIYFFIKGKNCNVSLDLVFLFSGLFLFLGLSVVNFLYDYKYDGFIAYSITNFILFAINSFLFLAILHFIFTFKLCDLFVARSVASFILATFFLYLLQLIFVDFKMFYINHFTVLDGYWFQAALNSFRGIGWQGLSIWDTSISYALLSVFLYPLFNSRGSLDRFILVVALLGLFVITFCSGRTGGFLFVFLLMLQIFLAKKYFFGLGFLVLLLILLLVSFEAFEKADILIDFAFEIMINLFSGEGLKSASTDDLIDNHLYIPLVSNQLIGDGYYINDDIASKFSFGGSNKASDSAFVINYIGYGVVGVFITLCMTLLNSKIVVESISSICQMKNNKVFFYLIAFVFFFFVYLKGPIYHSQTYIKVISFLWFFSQRMRLRV
ncbi:MAG: hypothetical protein ACRC38_10485 [Plesiomonas sp.]